MSKPNNQPPVNDPLGLGDVPPAAGAEGASPQASQPPSAPPAEPAAKKEKGEKKAARQGDKHRPRCPNCSQEGNVVLCTAKSTQALFTYYACPNGCGYTEKRARPDMQERIRRQQQTDEDQAGFGAR